MKVSHPADVSAELLAAGASRIEAKRLSVLAAELSGLGAQRQPIQRPRQTRRWRYVPAAAIAVLCLLLSATLFEGAQAALPGSWLYPLQRVSDNVAIGIQPAYRGTLMMKRAQQVRWLAAKHAAAPAVLAVLADYTQAAAGYRHSSDNYPVFEFCESNLRQAAAATPDASVQGAIKHSLAQLQNT
jgi:hypothetical protein